MQNVIGLREFRARVHKNVPRPKKGRSGIKIQQDQGFSRHSRRNLDPLRNPGLAMPLCSASVDIEGQIIDRYQRLVAAHDRDLRGQGLPQWEIDQRMKAIRHGCLRQACIEIGRKVRLPRQYARLAE